MNIQPSTSKRSLDSLDSSDGFKRPKPGTMSLCPANVEPSTFVTVIDSSKRSGHRKVNFQSLNQYTRHKLLVNYYVLTNPDKVAETFSRDRSKDKSEFSVLLENHQFIWSDEDLDSAALTWGQRVAKKYYEKLFKEYCIIDLSRYVENKFGMRWRTESEVIDGKGQFSCGAKRCPVRGGLTSWEVLFSYVERSEKKSALIKVRLCPECSDKLNYHHVHKKAKIKEKKAKKNKSSKSEATSSSASSSFIPAITIKEEILTDTESDGPNKGNNNKGDNNTNSREYQDLIDQIWKQPVKLEPEETEATLEEEVDDYLNQLFL